MPFGTEAASITIRDNITEVIDIASPIAGGTLGTVHVGLNMTQIKHNIRNLLLKIMYVGAGSLVFLSVLTMWAAARTIAPVKDLMRVAEALGRGDLSKKANVKRGDELGQLGDTFNQTIDRLQGLIQTESDRDKMQHQVMDLLSVVSTAAEGDLTIKAEVTADALGSVADAFNLMINGLTNLVTQASNVASEIQRSTSEILHSSERMRLGAEQQADQIRTASDAVNTMSHTTQRMAENAEAATQTSLKATQAAVKGGTSVAETIKGMQRIRAAVQTTGKKIKGLGERSLEIGAIIEVINEIATQTNLLALNAAIEAARAGEQGKGFAVVADEVRKLAERAARATKDITGLIKGIQVETSEAVTVMEEGTREVEEGTKLADQAGAALREIEQIVKQTATARDGHYASRRRPGEGDRERRGLHGQHPEADPGNDARRAGYGVHHRQAGGTVPAPDGCHRPVQAERRRRTHPSLKANFRSWRAFPSMTEQVTTSDEEIKLGFIE